MKLLKIGSNIGKLKMGRNVGRHAAIIEAQHSMDAHRASVSSRSVNSQLYSDYIRNND